MLRDRIQIPLLLAAAACLSGCGAVWVNQGAKNEPLVDGLRDPSLAKAKVVVAPEQKLISDFENGSIDVNPKLLNGGGGSWNAYTYGGNTINNPFVVDGGANGTQKAVHIFGALLNKGDGQYPSFTLTAKLRSSGLYDASPFSGIGFYYKCPPTDTTPYHKISIPIAATSPTSGGGTCTDGCYNHFGFDLKGGPDWEKLKLPFSAFKRAAGWGSPIKT